MARPGAPEGVGANALTFHIDRGKWVLGLLGCVGFVVVGYLIRQESVFGWASMIFFGLLIPLYLRALLMPHSMRLHLDSEGFEMGSYFKRKRIRWADIQGFELDETGVLPIGGTKVIRIVNAQHNTVGYTIANSYEASLTVIMHTLNEWRTRHSPIGTARASSS